MNKALKGLRLAVTIPPRHFFGGVDGARAIDTVDALRELGAVVLEFDTDAAYRGDRGAVARQIEDLKSFRPDALVAASQAGYVLQAGMYDGEAEEHLQSRNIFLEIPDLRMIMYWDHVIPQMPRYIIKRWPDHPGESGDGVIGRMRDIMQHPRMAHFIPDSGHVAELRKMQVVPATVDYAMVTSIPRVFLACGDQEAGGEPEHDIAFFGNLYLSAGMSVSYGESDVLKRIRDRASDALAADWRLAPYHAYIGAIEATDQETRSQLRLNSDQTFYWRYLFDELSVVANGEPRFRKIAGLGRPICYFGGFADLSSRGLVAAAGWTVHETAQYGAALAARYRNVAISVDVVNAPFISGFSPKLFECYAAGGFMLTSRCDDLRAAIGDLADTITYASSEELCAKVDRYLGRPAERREIAREIREAIRRSYTAVSLLARTVPSALHGLGA